MHIMNAYEALDARGLPYVRAAKTVAELGWADSNPKCNTRGFSE